jgi:Transposase DDE domain group 1
MIQDMPMMLPFARLRGKSLQGDFKGGTLSSDSGVVLLRETEAHIGVIGRFVQALDDRRAPRSTDHSSEEMLSQRIFQSACGDEDADDCDALRHDPAFKAACDRLPIAGKPLASQPTMSRWENASRRSELSRMAQGLFETFVASYERAPQAILLAIDDTADEVHGAQQQSLFHGDYDAYCSLPLHIYEGPSGKLITSILRPGRRPSGPEMVAILQRVVGAIRRQWPEVSIGLRGDSPLRPPEVQQWGERQEPVVCSILGQSGNAVLERAASYVLDQARSLYRDKPVRAERKQGKEQSQQQPSKPKKATCTSQQ